MTANRNRVEHAITETLNGQQLGCPNIQQQLADLRRADPRNFLENIRLMENLTANYKDFPHLELQQAEAQAQRERQLGQSTRPNRHNGELRIQAAPVGRVQREELPPLTPLRY